MTLAGWLAALAVGLLAGGISGLVGIGGGAVMVPFLYFFLARPELVGIAIPPQDQPVIAHATSLLVIVPISVRGAWLYSRAGLVDWGRAWRMAVASVGAAVIGALVAVNVPGALLKAAFGLFLLAAAARLLVGDRFRADDAEAGPADGAARAFVGGGAVGFMSALLGVGGGLVAIPVLLYWVRLPLRKVSATSLAIITVTALTGVGTYVVTGWWGRWHVAGAVQHLNLPVAAALALGALLAVPVGTRLQQSLSLRALRWVFAVLFLALGGRIAVGSLFELLAH